MKPTMHTKREQYLEEREQIAEDIKALQVRRSWLTRRISLIDYRERQKKSKKKQAIVKSKYWLHME